MSEGITGGETKLPLECVCRGRVFAVIVTPRLEDGAARIQEMYCVTCQRGVRVDEGKVGQRKVEESLGSYTVDKDGKKHYHLKADAGVIGTSLQ